MKNFARIFKYLQPQLISDENEGELNWSRESLVPLVRGQDASEGLDMGLSEPFQFLGKATIQPMFFHKGLLYAATQSQVQSFASNKNDLIKLLVTNLRRIFDEPVLRLLEPSCNQVWALTTSNELMAASFLLDTEFWNKKSEELKSPLLVSFPNMHEGFVALKAYEETSPNHFQQIAAYGYSISDKDDIVTDEVFFFSQGEWTIMPRISGVYYAPSPH